MVGDPDDFHAGVGTGPRRLSFGFLLARIALSVGFVLLGLALSVQVVATKHRPADLFGLPFHTLDGALYRFLRPALVIPRGFDLPLGGY